MDRLVRFGLGCLILLLASTLYAGGIFFGATGGTSGGGGGGSSCTIPTNWAEVDCSSATNCNVTSATKTLTVPAGNSGTLKFNIAGGHTMQYSKNGGAFTTVADNGTVVFANSDTIALKILTLTAGFDEDTITVTDNTTTASVGSFYGQNTHA